MAAAPGADFFGRPERARRTSSKPSSYAQPLSGHTQTGEPAATGQVVAPPRPLGSYLSSAGGARSDASGLSRQAPPLGAPSAGQQAGGGSWEGRYRRLDREARQLVEGNDRILAVIETLEDLALKSERKSERTEQIAKTEEGLCFSLLRDNRIPSTTVVEQGEAFASLRFLELAERRGVQTEMRLVRQKGGSADGMSGWSDDVGCLQKRILAAELQQAQQEASSLQQALKTERNTADAYRWQRGDHLHSKLPERPDMYKADVLALASELEEMTVDLRTLDRHASSAETRQRGLRSQIQMLRTACTAEPDLVAELRERNARLETQVETVEGRLRDMA
eukprot:TRINITY_DN35339_c0_g1_i1.p1 TRINITY_DN35339_c0_g1~~TRINITY_DN35339_c0_g1_i1.p1  ORF type:complete len:336 (-),score=64.56 TRINITY_DN35339_c0_g1_i1:124-1131(-)